MESCATPATTSTWAGSPSDSASAAAEQLIHADPEVRALMAQFRTARIVPGSIQPIAADSGPTTPPKASPP